MRHVPECAVCVVVVGRHSPLGSVQLHLLSIQVCRARCVVFRFSGLGLIFTIFFIAISIFLLLALVSKFGVCLFSAIFIIFSFRKSPNVFVTE